MHAVNIIPSWNCFKCNATWPNQATAKKNCTSLDAITQRKKPLHFRALITKKKNEKRKMEFCENCRVEFGALFVLFQVRDNKSQLQNENKIRKKTWTNGDWSKQSVENWMWRNEREVDFCFILFLCSVALLKSKLTCYGWRRISQIEMDSFCVWQTTKSSHKKVIIKT